MRDLAAAAAVKAQALRVDGAALLGALPLR